MADKIDVWQGTLALMVLRTLEVLGAQHGYGIARRIEETSRGKLALNYGTLYPALLKLEQEGYIKSEWGESENNRRAKFYRLTAAGKKQLAAEAREVATKIADAFKYVGVLAVEMFVVAGAGEPSLLVNEIAPRVHNSGHWALDGASISQFEQHIRAIAGWPLGKPVRHGEVTMTNLIGDDILSYEQWLTVPGATVHLYGKGAPRPGRKMGHVTEVAPASKK